MKEERQRLIKLKNLMGDEDGDKMPIPVKLDYEDEGKECKHLEIRKVQKHDEKEEQERTEMEKARCFLTHLEWQKEEKVQGGISWLELYILSILHGGLDQHNPANRSLTKTISLQTAIKKFKRRARKVALHCMKKKEEWNIHTCDARKKQA